MAAAATPTTTDARQPRHPSGSTDGLVTSVDRDTGSEGPRIASSAAQPEAITLGAADLLRQVSLDADLGRAEHFVNL